MPLDSHVRLYCLRLLLTTVVSTSLFASCLVEASEALGARLQSACLDTAPEDGKVTIHLGSQGEEMCRFRVVATPERVRPFVHVTVLVERSQAGETRERLSLWAVETGEPGEVATPWISLVGSFWKTENGPSVRAVPGDRLVILVSVGGRAPTKLMAEVSSSRDLGPVLRAPLAIRVVSDRTLGARERRAALRTLAVHLDWTNEVLGQCGIAVDVDAPGSVEFAQRPLGTMLAIGDDFGLVPTGIAIELFEEGKVLGTIRLDESRKPENAAARIAKALEERGLDCRTFVSPRRSSQANAVADLSCSHADGIAASLGLGASGGALVAVAVELRDGLSCYGFESTAVGSAEQRALVHGLWDEPAQIPRVVVVERLACAHQLGQSIAEGKSAPLNGTVFLDRRGLARGRETFTLAHELGHVLLGTSSHPEDSGVADASLLMNAQSSSIFRGPHRISKEQCQVMRRSPWLRPAQR